ncbi:glutamate--cysteine ligase [Halocatena salina]|uniref:Glutamate--cysteine ligase n=1 Tax=Halocatena salina TaxID=2934340 RepID=A0A8U0A588_9EURY|nr:glutamate--cysteine ligase [Halocatena salina]UPM43113.1 glutamate--cysteine ligase [Halocatena salina]
MTSQRDGERPTEPTAETTSEQPSGSGDVAEIGSPEAFDQLGTIGIEEEFYVVDERGRPTSGTDELVYESTPPAILEERLDHELFKCVIETQTPVIERLDSAEDTLRTVRAALVDHAEAHGYTIAAAGLHPAAKWRELEHAQKPRYRSQLDRIQYPQHRNTTTGLHVHVGVDDADKATWIANRLRWHLPIMLALSANSPFWNGYDTGLASARAKIFEGLPNTGMPTAFDSFEEFLDLERRMIDTGSIRDRGELWYEVRPHSVHGTVEIRTPDAQADPERVLAFVEYTHALVMDYAARYEDGEHSESTRHRRETLDENKWRAIRSGHDASFIDRDCTGVVDLGEAVERECERLGITGLRRLYEAESGAQRQRRIHRERGLDALCRTLTL